MKMAVYALTHEGATLGRRLADRLGADLFLPNSLAGAYGGVPFDRIAHMVATNFISYSAHIFIAATGIVVRSIGALLKSKDQDPAVIVLDQQGNHVISLLSGHLGGANDLAKEVAKLTGGEAVITTATDTLGVPSIDLLAKDKGLVISNLEAVKSVNMAIIRGEPIQIFDPEDRLSLQGQKNEGLTIEWIDLEDQWDGTQPGVWVTWGHRKPGLNQLILHPRCLIAGVGCNRGTKAQEITDLIEETCHQHGLCMKSLKCLTTIDEKRDEHGLTDAAQQLDLPLFYFSREQIASVEVPHPSDVVKKHMGVSSVCEATALLKSGRGRLLVPKTKSLNATFAVALEG